MHKAWYLSSLHSYARNVSYLKPNNNIFVFRTSWGRHLSSLACYCFFYTYAPCHTLTICFSYFRCFTLLNMPDDSGKKSFKNFQVLKVKSYWVSAGCLREQKLFSSARRFYLHKLTRGSSLQDEEEKELNSKWMCNEETVFFLALTKTERDKEISNADVWSGMFEHG